MAAIARQTDIQAPYEPVAQMGNLSYSGYYRFPTT
jgi:hypothetical protein